jgi:hypothetical protein
VIFDLAKPYSDLHAAVPVAAAVATGKRVRVKEDRDEHDEEADESPIMSGLYQAVPLVTAENPRIPVS